MLLCAKNADCIRTQPNHDGTRERSRVDGNSRIEAFGVHEQVGEHETPFSIGIDHFDRLAVRRAHHVARLDCRTGRHVGRRADNTHHIDGELHPPDRFHRTHHAGSAAHVVLHPLHFRSRLDRYAAGVEAKSLADQHDWLRIRRAALVLERDESRLFGSSLRNGQERTHPFLLHLASPEHRHRHPMARRDLAADLHKGFRCAVVARHHAKPFRDRLPFSHGKSRGKCASRVNRIGDQNGRIRQRCATIGRRRSCAELPILPATGRSPQNQPFDRVIGRVMQENVQGASAQLDRLARSDGRGASRGRSAERHTATADEKHPLYARVPTNQQKRLIARAAEIPSRERAGDCVAQLRVYSVERGRERRVQPEDDHEQRCSDG